MRCTSIRTIRQSAVLQSEPSVNPLYYTEPIIMQNQQDTKKIIHEELTYPVRGVLFDVYNKLGPKLPEKLYQQAITHKLQTRGITCEPEKQFEVMYRNESAGTFYIDHWIENGKLLIELKVAPKILSIHQAQTISYLKLTNADLAIIANFGAKSLQDKRLPNFIRNKTATFQWHPPTRKGYILYPALTDSLMKALYQVHFTLGPGFIHRVYRQAMMIELRQQSIGYEYIHQIMFYCDNYPVGEQEAQVIKADNKVLLGIFAVGTIDETMEFVMKSWLKQLGLKVGLLANFYGEQLVVKRVLRSG